MSLLPLIGMAVFAAWLWLLVGWAIMRDTRNALNAWVLALFAALPFGWPFLALYFASRVCRDLRRIADALEVPRQSPEASPITPEVVAPPAGGPRSRRMLLSQFGR